MRNRQRVTYKISIDLPPGQTRQSFVPYVLRAVRKHGDHQLNPQIKSQ